MHRFLLVATAGVLASGVAQAQVTEDDLQNDQSVTTQIVTNGMGRHLQRYSPLDIINTSKRQEPGACLGLFLWWGEAARPGKVSR